MLEVINLGLPRTGTRSFQAACNALGYVCDHYVSHIGSLRAGYNGIAELSIAECLDTPALDDVSVVMTIRDPESWLDSCQRVLRRGIGAQWNPFWRIPPERWLEEYRARWEYASALFGDRLLILNLCDGDGWSKLCPHLEKPVPHLPCPHDKNRL